jgi:hypothetical protein
MKYMDSYLEQLHMKEITRQAKEEIDIAFQKKKEEIREKYRLIRDILRKRKKLKIKELKDQLIDASKTEVNDDIAERVNDKILEKINALIRYFIRKEEDIDIEESEEIMKIEAIREKYYKARKIVAYTVIAALVITYANKAYRKYMKQVQSKCVNEKGKAYEYCLKKERISGLKIKIREANNRISECEKSSNPYKCRAEVHKYIIKIRDRLVEYAKNIEIDAAELE